MDPPSGSTVENGTARGEDRLDSWKEIAAYLNRNVRTLYRWEQSEGLPVHRHQHRELGSVYAFKSELDAWLSARSARGGREQTGAAAPAPRRRTAIALAVASAVVAMGAIAWFAATRPRQDRAGSNSAVAGLELISTFPGSHRWPSLSPDGRMMAFVSDAGGTPQVWVRALSGGTPIQITSGDLPAVRPRWSARGDRIVYSAQGGGIWSVAPLGGEPRRIVEHGWNAELSPDGQRLVFERAAQILTANADGTGEATLLGHPRGAMHYYGDAWPTFSPDGTSIAMFLGEAGRYGDYWVMPAAGGAPRRLTNDFSEGAAPAWTPDGRFVVFPSARTGSVNLWRVPIAGGTPEALTTGAGDDGDPAVSPDGRTLLFSNVKRTWSVVVHDIKSGQRTTLIEQRQPLVFPTWSPDGRRIALAGRTARGETQLLVMNADGSNLTAITDGAGELNVMPRWAEDGQALYFYQVRPMETFRRVSAAGGPSREIAPWSVRRQFQADVDPRGRAAAYSALDDGVVQQSRVRNLETGEEATLSIPLTEQRFSRDGRWIAGQSRDGEVVGCEVSTGRCRPITPKTREDFTSIAWSADGTTLFFLRPTRQRVLAELISVGVQEGVVTMHGLIGPFQQRFLMSMDVSPRDEVIFVLCREAPHELWMAKLQ